MRSKGRAPCLDQHPWGFQPLPPGKPPGPELPWWVRATCTKPALKLQSYPTTLIPLGKASAGLRKFPLCSYHLILISLHSHAAGWMRNCDCTSCPSSLHVFSIPSSWTHSLCSSPKGLSTDTLHIRHCNGQPGLWCSLRKAHWQGSHGPLALDTMLRSDLHACCLWPMVSKAVSPKYLFPVFGVPPEPPPSPAAQFAFAEGTPQCRSCPSALSGHGGCGLGEPSCPQKSCCRGVINIPIAHVPCWLASRDKCSAHVPVERGDFPGLIQCFPFLLSYTPISVEAMNMSCWISVHPANFPFSQGEIFII